MMLHSLKVTLTEFPCSHVAIEKHVVMPVCRDT